MKNLTLILFLFSSLNLFSQFQFAGEIKQEKNTTTTIEVLSSTEGYTYICPQIIRTFGASSIFDLKLEKNTHYTLVFRSGKFDKYVYVDTHGISAYNEFRRVLLIFSFNRGAHWKPTLLYCRSCWDGRWCKINTEAEISLPALCSTRPTQSRRHFQ